MSEWVVDTNVLLVATRAALGRPPRRLARRGEDVCVTTEPELQAVFCWLEQMRKDPTAAVVLDRPHDLIKGEYCNKIDKDEYGRMVIADLLTKGRCRFVDVDMDNNGDGVVQHEQGDEVFDRADRKMVAAAIESKAPIVNVCDSDWIELEHRGTLARLGVAVEHVIEEWCRAEWERKRKASK